MRYALIGWLAIATVAPAAPIMADPFPTPIAWPDKVAVNVAVPQSSFDPEVTFAAGGAPFVAVGRNSKNEARVFYDLRTGKPTGSVVGEMMVGLGQPRHALSADGKLFAMLRSPMGKSIVTTFDTTTGKPVGEFLAPQRIEFVEFAGADQVLVFSNHDQSVALFAARTGAAGATFKVATGFAGKPHPVVTPGGKYVIAADKKQISIYETATGQMAQTIAVPPGKNMGDSNVEALAIAPDGRRLAALLENRQTYRIVSWDITDSKQLADVDTTKPRNWATSASKLTWTADGTGWLYYGEATLDTVSGQPVFTLAGRPGDRTERMAVNLGTVLEIDATNRQARRLVTRAMPAAQLQAAQAAIKSGGSASDAALPTLTPVERGTIKPQMLSTQPPKWAVTPDPAPGAAAIVRAIPLPIPGENIWSVRVTGGAKPLAVVEYATLNGFQPDPGAPRVVRWVDLLSGTAIGGKELPPGCAVLSASPTGAVVTTDGSQRRIDVWGEDGQPRASWVPHAETEPNRKIVWAAALTGDRVLTASEGGQLVLWSLPKCQPVFVVAATGMTAWQLTPGGRYVAGVQNGVVRLLDTSSGALVGDLGKPGAASPAGFNMLPLLTISPTGQELLRYGFGGTGRWNLATGQELPTPTMFAANDARYAGPNHLLTNNGSSLYSLAHQAVVWTYTIPYGAKLGTQAPDGRAWFLLAGATKTTSVLVPAELPSPEEAKSITAVVDGPGRLIPRAGKVSVALNLAGAQVGDAQTKTLDMLTKSWATRGLTLVPTGGDLSVNLNVSERDTGDKLSIRLIGGLPQTIQVRVLELDLTTTVKVGNETVWNPPAQKRNMRTFGLITLPRGETDFEGYLHKQLWQSVPSWAETFALPRFLARTPEGVRSLPGRSTLTATGPVEAK